MILLVDDEPLNRKVLQWSLSKLGHEFIHAQDGQEAIEKVLDGGIDVILLDLMMPNLDGYGFLAWRAGADESVKRIPIIINSAVSDMDSIRRALGEGAYDYFTKPLSNDQLEILLPTKVYNAIQSHKAVKALNERNEKMRSELAAAEHFQRSMLPRVDKNAVYGHAYVYSPCDDVGGDFYDVLPAGKNRTAFFLGDVTGHGLKAGMMSLMVKSLLRELVMRDPEPTVLLPAMNQRLLEIFETGHYITGIYGLVDPATNSMVLANCAHPRPILVTPDGETQAVEGGGHFLGILDEIDVETVTLPFDKDHRLVFYTDGITEVLDASGENELGVEGLVKIVQNLTESDVEDWPAAINDAVCEYHGGPAFNDDLLIVAAWCRPLASREDFAPAEPIYPDPTESSIANSN
ncbi:MAG: fused response regulator/phosphatase [Deltaproteobacteria bacterium]|nr:fused response regulator/phosphatase [bacterium]MCB9489280.1 fused response regulator/phosphatase [Deltaproteobacteria bacterium]